MNTRSQQKANNSTANPPNNSRASFTDFFSSVLFIPPLTYPPIPDETGRKSSLTPAAQSAYRPAAWLPAIATTSATRRRSRTRLDFHHSTRRSVARAALQELPASADGAPQ